MTEDRIDFGPLPKSTFELLDHKGKRVTAETYHGFYTMVYFGFTNCRVVCPRTLAKLSAALDDLRELADAVQPLYTTVDPERDTPEAMHKFLRSYPRFIGLTGSAAEIDRAKQAFRVFTRRADDPVTGYAVSHSAVTYVMDRHGSYAAHFLESASAEQIARRLRSVIVTQQTDQS
jgi:protein SCO1